MSIMRIIYSNGFAILGSSLFNKHNTGEANWATNDIFLFPVIAVLV